MSVRPTCGGLTRARSSWHEDVQLNGRVTGACALAYLAVCAGLVACSPRAHGDPPWQRGAGSADADVGAAESALTLAPREGARSEAYPCSDCHDADMETDPEPRVLEDDHEAIVLRHGSGRFWCLECHDTDDRDELVAIAGKPVPFERADRVCAKCHIQQQRDFLHGAHGKRVGHWRGERVVWPCVKCHDPHAPAIAPRKPMPGPDAPGAAGRRHGARS